MVERGVKSDRGGGGLFLPPGFRFHPTDEEVITSYLLQKLLNPRFDPRAMGEVDLNKCEPWDLPSKAKMVGEKEWYFFCHKDMKYPTGTRTNRATKEGYWKATGRDREIFKPDSAGGHELVGMKKALVFYMGRAPRGSKTNWVMHEFRLEGTSRHNNANLCFNPKDEWVVCKVHHKNGEAKKPAEEYSTVSDGAGEGDEFLESMINPMYFNSAASSLPSATTTINPPTAATSSSFVVDVPNYGGYSFNDTRSIINTLHQVTNSGASAPRITTNSSYISSWANMLQANHNQAMGSYNLHHQAMMVKALGGAIISPNFAGGLPTSSATAILQQNSPGGMPQQQNLGAATIGPAEANKNLFS